MGRRSQLRRSRSSLSNVGTHISRALTKRSWLGDKHHKKTQTPQEELTDFTVTTDLLQSPQEYLDELLESRGYSRLVTQTTVTKHMGLSGSHCEPTRLQQASYSNHLIKYISDGNVNALRDIMTCGISSNPCSSSGSLVNIVCLEGQHECLRVMVEECGTSLMVTDVHGKSPLHDACWAKKPTFEIIDIIMKNGGGARLFQMTDNRGALPLDYVPSENWSAWIDWLDSNKDEYWPLPIQQSNDINELQPLTPAVPDPSNALTPEVARLVVTGNMTPEEARCLRYELDESKDEDRFDDSFVSSDDDNFSDLNSSVNSVTLVDFSDILVSLSRV